MNLTDNILSSIGLHELCGLYPGQTAICPFCLSKEFFILYNSHLKANWYYCKNCTFSGDVLDISQTKLGLDSKEKVILTIKEKKGAIPAEDEILYHIAKEREEASLYEKLLKESDLELKNNLEEAIKILNAQFNLSIRAVKNKFLSVKLKPYLIYVNTNNLLIEEPLFATLHGLNAICHTLPGKIIGFYKLKKAYKTGKFISITGNTSDHGFIIHPQLWKEKNKYIFVVPPSIFFKMQIYAPPQIILPLIAFIGNSESYINLHALGKPVFWLGQKTPTVLNHKQMLQLIQSQALFIPYIPPLAEKYYLRQNPQYVLEFLLRYAKPWQEMLDHFLTHASYDEVNSLTKKIENLNDLNPGIATLIENHPELKTKWERRLYSETSSPTIKRIKSKNIIMYETKSGWYNQAGELLISGHLKPLFIDEKNNLHLYVHILPDDVKGIIEIPIERVFSAGMQAIQEEILAQGLGYLYIDERIFLSVATINLLMKMGGGPIPCIFSQDAKREASLYNRPGWSPYLQEFVLEGKSYKKYGVVIYNYAKFNLPADHPIHEWSNHPQEKIHLEDLRKLTQTLVAQHVGAIENLKPLPIIFQNIPYEDFLLIAHSIGAVSDKEAAQYFHITDPKELKEELNWPFYFSQSILPTIDFSYSFCLLHETQEHLIKKGNPRLIVNFNSDAKSLANFNSRKGNPVGRWAAKCLYNHFLRINTCRTVKPNKVRYLYSVKNHEELTNIYFICKWSGFPVTEPVLEAKGIELIDHKKLSTRIQNNNPHVWTNDNSTC